VAVPVPVTMPVTVTVAKPVPVPVRLESIQVAVPGLVPHFHSYRAALPCQASTIVLVRPFFGKSAFVCY